MPIRGEEIQVTDEDITAASSGGQPVQRSHESLRAANLQRIIAFIQSADSEELARIRQALDRKEGRTGAGVVDRAFLSLYVNLTPFILSLVFIVPLVVWLGWVYGELRPFFVGSGQSCPPNCNWGDIAYWAGVGGVSLLTAVLVSYALRGRLVKATKKG